MARISPGTMTAAIFAILVGLAGAYMVRQYLSRPEAAVAQQAAEMITVPVAGVDLMAGRSLTINDIAIHRMTREEFARSGYANQEFMTEARQIAGRMLKQPLKKGDAFLTTSLYPEGMGPGVAELLKPGQRAVTVSIENVGAVEGFARPGTLVDVLYRSTATETVPEVTMTLLDRVEVLAVGKISVPGHDVSVGGAQNDRGTVTLAVNPEQAKALKVVEGRGELTLSLRNPEDAATLSSVGYEHHKVTLFQVLGLPEPKGPKSMDIYLGGVKNTVTFGPSPGTRNPVPAIDNSIRTPIAADDPRTIRSTSPVVKSKFSATSVERPNGT